MKSIIIAGVVAALVAASTATAALIVTSKNIKNGTIQMVDISAGTKRALKGNRGPAGPPGQPGAQGNPGAAGAQGPPGIQSLTPVTNSVPVPPDTTAAVTAECPSGQRPISGGFHFGGIIIDTFKNVSGWSASGYNDLTIPLNITAFAYCSPNVTAAAGTTVSSAELERLADARRASH